jgi:hypothetical protein
MNLRILKKLSKRAAPLLLLLGDRRELFKAEKGENYHGLNLKKCDRKHWERFYIRGNHWDKIRPPDHPLKGTMMIGGMSGYEEPEWSEETAWSALRQTLMYYYFHYDEATDVMSCTRKLRSIADVFRAAEDAIVEIKAKKP